MRTWIISDTHTFHDLLLIPEVDCVIHCGDFSNKANPYENEHEARKFLEWYKSLPIKYKILNCGNHDTSVFKGLIKREDYNFIWPEHDIAKVEGFTIFVSPYTPVYGKGWSYMYKRNKGKVYWDAIPDNVDILVTHGPPKGILDWADDENDRKRLVNAGCKSLFNRVMEIKPLIHCFGHIHDSSRHPNKGVLYRDDTYFVNAACLNHVDNKLFKGRILDIQKNNITILA